MYNANVFAALVLGAVGLCSAATPVKSYPGSAKYPTVAQWTQFNTTLGGKLIAGLPPQAVCYAPQYNEAQCSTIGAQLMNASYVAQTPLGIDSPWWSGNDCPATLNGAMGPAGGCQLGNYSTYVVEASTASDVSMAVKFAAAHNLRLIVKNTGHDILGR